MVIAALVCFVALVIAWIVAPDGAPAAREVATVIEPELAPAAA